jgi:uncharacterized protein (PEP-CTERM system associated)
MPPFKANFRAMGGRGRHSIEVRRVRRLSRRIVVASIGLATLTATSVFAQQMRIDTSIDSKLTWTDNALFGVAAPKSDFVLNLQPRLAISGEGPRMRVAGTVEMAALTYLGGTRPSRLLPNADLTARVEPIGDLLFLEGQVRSSQEIENAFGARSESRGTATTHALRELRLSPYVNTVSGSGLHFGFRSDNVRTNESRKGGFEFELDAPSASGYFGQHSLFIAQDPRPVGWRVEAERSDTRYSDSLQPKVVLDVARLGVDYALEADLKIGVRGGYERNSFFAADALRPIYGVEVTWRPTPRTKLAAFEERRYFGPAWRLEFDHRMPFLAWSLLASRGTESATQGLLQLPASGNVAGLLDALFTTRFPDPIERAQKVREYMAQQGLPDSTQGATRLFSQRLSLATRGNGSVALIGMRSSLLVSGFYRRTTDAPEAGDLATGRSVNNNLQRGFDVILSHRVTPVVSFTVACDFSRSQALASVGTERTTQAGGRIGATVQLAPKTSLSLGGSAIKLVSNTLVSGHQISVYAGLNHSFR